MNHVEMIGHASFRVHHGGKTLLTDPWYIDPINCNTNFHWPPLIHDIHEVASTTDVIWLSHNHPDHFNPPTLALFPRRIPIYIGAYRDKGFRDEIRSLGFEVHELPFQHETPIAGTEFSIASIESDYEESASYDSSVVIRTPGFTTFNNNDCFLKRPKYEWVRDRYGVDFTFLGFSPASYFPICFEFEDAVKARLLQDAADRRFGDFLGAAEMLRPRLAIPFAMGIRFLHESMLWQNREFNSAAEAVRRLRARGLAGEVLNPGDRLLENGQVWRRDETPVMDTAAEEEAAIRAHAMRLKPWIDDLWAREEPARPDLIPRFREYMTALWKRSAAERPDVTQNIIAYRVEGPCGGRCYFDFSRPPDQIFRQGEPARFDMRYTYLDRMLQLRMDGKIDWDELHFSNRVSVCQHRYAAQFYGMLRSST